MTALENVICFMWLQVFFVVLVFFFFGLMDALLIFFHVICLIWESFLVSSLECEISQLCSSMTSCGLFSTEQ